MLEEREAELPGRNTRRLVVAAIAALVGLSASLFGLAGVPRAGALTNPVLAGAGDICVSNTTSFARAQATGKLIIGMPTATVFMLGDASNEIGTADQYANCYGKTWGSFLSRTHAAVGNHDCGVPACVPYYAYFGAAAGPAGKGYYSYSLANNWHVIVLNSQCTLVGGCAAGTPQEKWLLADLAANQGKHIIAMWHIPEFGSGNHSAGTKVFLPFWRDLYAAHADLILNGHEHDYERFALQSPSGLADANGIREIVVGTGGASSQILGQTRANSQVLRTGAFGVLVLTLQAHAYSWRFVSIDGSFTDSGTHATHI
jgi:hypothetical protein